MSHYRSIVTTRSSRKVIKIFTGIGVSTERTSQVLPTLSPA
jgi:hypothetical protein